MRARSLAPKKWRSPRRALSESAIFTGHSSGVAPLKRVGTISAAESAAGARRRATRERRFMLISIKTGSVFLSEPVDRRYRAVSAMNVLAAAVVRLGGGCGGQFDDLAAG